MNRQANALEAVKPIEASDPRKTTSEIQKALRELILSGRLVPGTTLSQVQVARRMNVSRTPVREALRMLQAEGLVSGEANRRCEVVGFTPALVDGLYAERIAVEALAGAITTRRALDADITELRGHLAHMEDPSAHADFELWRQPHAAFHTLLARHAAAPLRESAAEKLVRTQRFRALLQPQLIPGWWQRGAVEHSRIANAVAERDPQAAAIAIARHLARSALELLGEFAPQYEPICIRSALTMIEGSGGHMPLR